MGQFVVTELPLSGLKEITRNQIGDNRGFLSRVFCANELAVCGWNKPVAQLNHTYTGTKGTVRGMHFQHSPHAEMKLVSCLRGVVWDVAVDLRPESKTYCQWYGIELSAEKGNALLIPEGFAHGFQTISDDVELLYCHSEFYAPEFEAGLNPFDPLLSIQWPLLTTEISARDQAHPFIDTEFKGVSL